MPRSGGSMTQRERRRIRDDGVGLSLGELIRDRHRDILSEWIDEVCRLPVASGLDRPALVDHIPDVLDRIADMADALANGTVPQLPRAKGRAGGARTCDPRRSR